MSESEIGLWTSDASSAVAPIVPPRLIVLGDQNLRVRRQTVVLFGHTQPGSGISSGNKCARAPTYREQGALDARAGGPGKPAIWTRRWAVGAELQFASFSASKLMAAGRPRPVSSWSRSRRNARDLGVARPTDRSRRRVTRSEMLKESRTMGKLVRLLAACRQLSAAGALSIRDRRIGQRRVT